MKFKSYLKQRGISLLEVMLSLAIIAIILVMATRYFGLASSTQKLNTATGLVTEIQGGTEQYYSSRGNYPGSLTDLANAGFIRQDTASGLTPWSGTNITLDGATPPNITISGAWKDSDCANLANRMGKATYCTGSNFSIPAVIQQ
jgi:prepilin-type N-terminal cleavage/methylation domain-containing protein